MADVSSEHDSAPNFELYGKIYDFNDGHTPETFPKDSKGKIVIYNDDRTTTNGANQSTIQIYENVLPDNLCKKIYDMTCEMDEPWGTYVTKENALNTRYIDTNDDDNNDNAIDMDDIARQAVGFFLNGNHSQANLLHGSKPLIPFDDERVHGVQVWALSSCIGSSVAVHIDYAEYIRYCHNIIVPPLYVGTIQCTPYGIQGGDFAVNINGLKCYEEHGYKGSFMENRMGNWKTPNQNQSISSGPTLDENGWMTIPYKYNQGILHSGNLTHLSSPVKLIEGTDAKRVIVGFNVFAKDVGSLVEKVPEHSVQFRRLVKLNRSIKTNDSEGFSYNSIKTNKPLMKMLVLAKRQKVVSERRQLQRVVEEWLIQQFNDEQQFTVKDVLQKWKSDVLSSTSHPDIEITINLLVRSKKCVSLAGTDFRLVCENDSHGFIENGLLNVNTALRFVSVHDKDMEPQ
jgi:hypothetical protein